MTTQEIANKLVEYCRAGDYKRAHDELLSADIVSVEPKGNPMGIEEVVGIDAVNESLAQFDTMHKAVTSHRCSDPVIAGALFAVSMGLTTVQHDDSIMEVDEIAVYTTADGKIIRQEFFYKM